ncbi:MAG: GNAT family N-acetyltransferase [Patescibacteria group bacterium]
MSIEQILSHPQVEVPSPISVFYYDRAYINDHLDSLTDNLSHVTADALGVSVESMLDEQRQVTDGFDFLLTVEDNGTIVAYAGYIKHVTPVGVVLHESGKMTRKDQQGKGHGTRLTRSAIDMKPDVDFLSFSTQNPYEVASVKKALPNVQFAPIDKTYDATLQHALISSIAQRNVTDVNLTTDLRQALYGKRFGDYTITPKNPTIAKIEHSFAAIDFVRERGDGVYIVGKISQE